MKKTSKTDINRLSNMDDSQIDLSDIPELDADFFEKAEIRLPNKEPVTLRLDADVLQWYRSQGKGYQTRINKLLRGYMEAQQSRDTSETGGIS